MNFKNQRKHKSLNKRGNKKSGAGTASQIQKKTSDDSSTSSAEGNEKRVEKGSTAAKHIYKEYEISRKYGITHTKKILQQPSSKVQKFKFKIASLKKLNKTIT